MPVLLWQTLLNICKTLTQPAFHQILPVTANEIMMAKTVIKMYFMLTFSGPKLPKYR
jgi:hypothetical protein